MKKRSILLATDLSANSAFAARWAAHWSKAAGVEVIVGHVIEINVPNWVRDAYDALEDETKRQKLEDKIHHWYETHAHAECDGVLLATGNIDKELARMAYEIDASMIVVAKSGKGAVSRFIAGSTAQMMAANPPRPVVVVHPDHTGISSDTKIAVATDLTDTAEVALTGAALMAHMLGSHLDILHASNVDSSSVSEEDLPESLDIDSLTKEASAQLDTILERHADELGDIDFKGHVLNDAPVAAITNFAEEHDIDIVVVGNAAEYNVVTNVFGRVSVKLCQTLPCSSMVIPPNAKLFSERSSEQE